MVSLVSDSLKYIDIVYYFKNRQYKKEMLNLYFILILHVYTYFLIQSDINIVLAIKYYNSLFTLKLISWLFSKTCLAKFKLKQIF